LIETPIESPLGVETSTWGCFLRMMAGAIGTRSRESSVIVGNDIYWGLRGLGDLPTVRYMEPDFPIWNYLCLTQSDCVRMLRSGGLL